jgi:hypothetical protein
MPDFLGFKITKLPGRQPVIMDRYRVEGRVVDSGTQQDELLDFRSQGALQFPSVLNDLTERERLEILELIIQQVILSRFGLRD